MLLLSDLAHYTHRMLQALDCYWEHCEGLSDSKQRTVRSFSDGGDWWNRYEKYRTRVEELIKQNLAEKYYCEMCDDYHVEYHR